MSEKTLKQAIYFLAAVTALYLLTTLLNQGGSGAPSGGNELAEALEAAAETTDRVVFSGPERTVTLERATDGWTVNGYLADSVAVARFWDALSGSRVGDVAATNPANHGRLGVTADSAWTLTIGQEDRLLLGHAGPQFGTAYVRLPDADEVYVLRGDLRSTATRPLADWRDKLVLAVDTALVAAVEVRRDGDTRRWERGDSTWSEGGGDADETEIRNLLQELAGFQATGFAADSVAMQETPDRQVRAFDAAGNEMASVSLDEGDGNLRALSDQSPYVFEVPSWRADRIAPERGDEG